MADSLGQVFSGQDGTGLAWKAPASTYDPVRGYPEYDAMKAKAVQDKAEKDNAQKKADLELLKYDPSKWQTGNTQYVAPYIDDVQNQITQMFTKSGGNLSIEDRVKANALSNELKLNVATLNDQGSALEKVQAELSKPGADKAFDIDATNEQFAVYSNPYISPEKNVQEQLREKEEKIRNNPNYAGLSDKAIQGRAALEWRAENGADYLVGQRIFDENNFIKELQGIRNFEKDAYSKGVSEGKYTDVKIDKYTQDRADELISKNYETWLPFKKEMQKKFSELSPSQQKVEGSPLEYAKRRYRKDLVVNDVFETSRESKGGGSGIGNSAVPDGVFVTKVTPQLNYKYKASADGMEGISTATDRSLDIKVGSKNNKKEPVFETSGTTYYSTDDITNPKQLTQSGQFTFQRMVKKGTLTEPIQVRVSDLKKIGRPEFLGYDLSKLIKKADPTTGMVDIDATGVPLDDKAISTLQTMGFGGVIQDRPYAFGKMAIDEKTGEGEYKTKKINGVYLPENDLAGPLGQELGNYDYLTDLNFAYPDIDYTKPTVKGSGTTTTTSKPKAFDPTSY